MQTPLALFQNLKLGTKLMAGFGALILLVALTGIQSIMVTGQLSRQALDTYEKDVLGITYALGARNDIIHLGRSIREVLLENDPARRQSIFADIEDTRARLDRNLEEFEKRIVRSQVKTLFVDFKLKYAIWNEQLNRIISLLKGNQQHSDLEALAIIEQADYIRNRDEAEDLMDRVGQLKSQFIAESNRDNAAAASSSMIMVLATLAGGILFGIGLSILINRSIRQPLADLQDSIDHLTQGKLDIPVAHTLMPNEVGTLARAIEVLQGRAVEQAHQRWIKQELVELDKVIQNAQTFEDFADSLNARVAPILGLVHGAFYLADPDGGSLRCVGGYAINSGHVQSFAPGQGIVGQVARDRSRVRLHIPGQSTVGVSVGLGLVSFEHLIVTPVIHLDAVLAVWELGSMNAFDQNRMDYLEELLPAVAAKLQILLGNVATRDLLARSQAQAQALAASEHQLQARRAELEDNQAVLAEAEERTRMILGAVNEGIWGFNPDGSTSIVNPAALRMLGYTNDEVFATAMHNLVHHHRADGTVYPLEECPMYQSRLDGMYRHVDDEVLWRKDGTAFPVEYEANPIRKNGKVVGTVIVFRDITERKELIRHMADERSKLQRILDTSPLGVGITVNGIATLVNPALREMINIEVGGRMPDVYVHPEDRARVMARISREGIATNEEVLMYDRQGHPRTMLATYMGTDMYGEGGVLGWLLDISDRKAAELEAQEAKESLNIALTSANMGSWKYLPAENRITSDDNTLRLYGLEGVEMAGDIGQWFTYVHPDDAQKVGAGMVETMQNRIADYKTDFRVVKPDQEVRHIMSIGKFTYADDGTPLLANGLVWDVTDIKNSETRIRISQERLDMALRGANLGLWDWQADPDVLVTNEIWCTMLGYTEAELDAMYPPTSARWAGMVHPDDLERASAFFVGFLNGEISEYRIELRMRTKSGEPKWVLAVGDAASRDANGKVIRMVGIHQDITEMKLSRDAMAEALAIAEDATRAKSDFLANMSHEIRTPMNAIIGMSHLALQTDLNPKQRNYISKVDAAARNLLGIINDILDFSKIEAGKMTFEVVPFHLEDVMENLADLSVIKAQDKGLELLFDVGTDVPTALVGDSLRLGQVLVNLVGNAIKFTEKGEITVGVHKLSESEGRVRLFFEIRDTGIGLTEAQRDKLFSAFSQADASTTRKYGGTGLGLTISKKLVELMSGEIGVDSEPGKGSNFHFTAEFGTQSEQRRVDFNPADAKGLRILVVDDNASAREILQSILKSLHFDTVAVGSGAEAIGELEQASLEHRPYGLVLMDWMMPGMDGVEAIKRIRADTHLAKTPAFVMVTAYSREELLLRAEGVQIDGVLVKPVSPSTLLDSILNALGKEVGKKARKQEKLASHKENAVKLRGRHLLLVEDNPVNQELALELLTEAGIVVDVAANGAEAVDLVSTRAYDGVLMDCQMPVMDGFEATRKIRQDSRFASLPILAMTANAMAGDREKCLEAGMNDHIAKPIDVAQLFGALSTWIRTEDVVPTPPPQPSPVPADQVPRVEGLDLEGAMVRVGGSAKLLRKLLVRFVETQSDVMARIKGAMDASDGVTATREAHTLKGLAGNIGADPLAKAAAAVEGMLNRGETGGLAEALTVMEGEVRSLVERIGAALGMGPAAAATSGPLPGDSGPVDSGTEPPDRKSTATDPLGPDLQKLAGLLADSDSEAADLAEALEPRLRGRLADSDLVALMKQIGEFDFDMALVQLRGIAGKLGVEL